MERDVLIAIGSNIDPERNIVAALDLLDAVCPINGVSSFYRTEAVARAGQPTFLNGACRCRTALAPRELKFGVLRSIEADIGRVRGADSHGPREIDLDIGLMELVVVNEDGLQIPDPDIEARAFVAIPFCELAPDAIVPTLGKSLTTIAGDFDVNELEKDSSFSERVRSRYMK